ncbi:MAG TPA: outer membrane beta-barrel protein [Arachidicoccus soli]|nr:outer membrane beta-barrel protein [Arachidicoccus soli]HEU0226422.1 outer membrane beta-barrel protein [Arachidicoccus soli]
MKRIFMALFVLFSLMALNAMGQDATDSTKNAPTLKISGSADGYYRYNFNAPSGTTNNLTSFTGSQNSFELGMASVRFDGSALNGKISATADLGFGRRAEEFSYTDGETANGHSTLQAVKQLYVNFAVGKNITFTLGKWATHIGYEVLDAYANRNYSMDYMFSYGPFSHTGFKAQYTKGSLGIMLGIANPTDVVTTTSTVKTLLGQVSESFGKTNLYLNYQGFFGAKHGTNTSNLVTYNNLKSLNQLDVVLTSTLSKQFSLGYNGTVQFRDDIDPTIGNKTWWGSALYLNYDPTDKVGLSLRGEYVEDKKASLLPATKLTDLTLTLDYKLGGQFSLMPELRYDHAAQDIFKNNDGNTNSTFGGLVAVVYHF